MRFELFIARRIALSESKSFSRFIVKIAIAAIALSLSVMIVATALVNGFQEQIQGKVMGFWAHIHVVPSNNLRSLKEEGIYIDQEFIDKAMSDPDVEHIQVSATKGGLIKTEDAFEGIILKGVGQDFDWSFFEKYLEEGEIIGTSDTAVSTDIIVSRSTANRMQLNVGDKISVSFMDKTIRMRPFVVSGIYNTQLEEFDEQYALADIGVIQQLNGWGKDSVGGFEIFLKGDNLLNSKAKMLLMGVVKPFMNEDDFYELQKDPIDRKSDEMYFGMMNPRLTVLPIKELHSNIFDWLNLQNSTEVIILVIMLIIAVLNMVTALLILILERTNMIGILKALGSSDKSIRRLFIINAAYIVGIGALIGNVVGIGLCLIQQQFGLITLPAESYYVSTAPISLSASWLVLLNVVTILLCIIIMTIPSMLVGRITPIKAIRFD